MAVRRIEFPRFAGDTGPPSRRVLCFWELRSSVKFASAYPIRLAQSINGAGDENIARRGRAVVVSCPVSTKDFHAEIIGRLRNSGATRAQMAMALAVLQQIRWYSIGPQLDVCSRSGAEIANELGIKSQDFSPVLALLENVGAVTRFADGREKIICLSPGYAEAERRRNRFREITLPLFTADGTYQFKVGLTNLKGFWKQFRNDLANLLASQQ